MTNQLKHRFMATLISAILMLTTLSMPVYAADIKKPVDKKEMAETNWKQRVMHGEEDKNISMRKNEKRMTAIMGERMADVLPKEEDDSCEAVLYVPRLEAPDRSNPYYYELNLYYKFGLGMPNCTAYAYGRAYEILKAEPKLSNGNAGRWWFYNIDTGAYAYGSEPRLGAIACWDDYNAYSGHVAVVEAIDGDRVTLSESHYGGGYFYVVDMNADSSDHATGRRFLGYIYIDEEL